MPSAGPKKRRKTDYDLDVTTVRISRALKDWITRQAQYQESFDSTLRRIVKFGENGTPHENAKSRKTTASGR